ncbi:MAG: ATP-binding cassette domain-containing protein [Acidobacteriota bacterium]|nr:ATP-binding cassette domain-containing protein [Acidobacteriota bacterium]
MPALANRKRPAELVVSDLTVEFRAKGYVLRPLDQLNLSAADGQLVALLGPSGCGKTTLLSCLAGLLTPTSGRIEFAGIDVTGLSGRQLTHYRRYTVGVVFQAFNLVRSLTARENVMAPLILTGLGRREAGKRAHELLELVGLAERMKHRPGELSGGQQQRVAIARALAREPSLLLADEPTAHLDHIQVESVLRVLRDIAASGRLVVLSTHDARVSRITDHVIELAPDKLPPEAPPRREELVPGQAIFTQGEQSDYVYVIESGEVEIFWPDVDGERTLATLHAGEYFGELGPALGLPRSASARASTLATLVAYDVGTFRRKYASQLNAEKSSRTPHLRAVPADVD